MLTHIHSFGRTRVDDLTEIYISILLRTLALSMSGIYIPIFLYQLGYEIWKILFYYFVAFFTMYLVVIPLAKLVGHIGPKHTIMISYVLQIMTMLSLIYLKTHPWFFVISAIMLGIGNICFFIGYHVDFSKVKHKKTGGSELGKAYLGERFGAFIGPVLGGVIGFMFGPKYIFIASLAVLIIAMIPLFFSKEPTRLFQKLHYKDFDIRPMKHDLVAYGSFAIEAATSLIVWPFFLGVYIFSTNPYLKIGVIMSATIVISIIIAKLYGKIIDRTGGRKLLRTTATLNGLLHLFRLFTPGVWGAVLINILNEILTPGYRMSVFKGFYSQADDYPGHRIVYISIMEMIAVFTRSVFFAFTAIFAYFASSGKLTFGVLFGIGAIASFLITREKFKVLNPTKA